MTNGLGWLRWQDGHSAQVHPDGKNTVITLCTAKRREEVHLGRGRDESTGEVYDKEKMKGAQVFEEYLKRCWDDEIYARAFKDGSGVTEMCSKGKSECESFQAGGR